MTKLERRCRFLLRVYPTRYRSEREDEMVATLLDLAPPGQRWPGAREAASIARHGFARRTRSLDELRAGLRYAGLIATGAAVALATAMFGIAFLPRGRGAILPPGIRPVAAPLGIEPVRVMVWSLVLLTLGCGALALRGSARMGSGALILLLSVTMLFGGSPVAGLRRRYLVPIALCCLLSLASAGARRRARGVALGLGIAGGVALVAHYVARFGSEPIGYPPRGGALWSVVERWVLVADVIHLDRQFWGTLLLVAGAAGFWRPRVWVAAALVSVPSGLVAFQDGRRWLVPEMAWIAVVLAALGMMALCRHSVATLWSARGRSETPAP